MDARCRLFWLNLTPYIYYIFYLCLFITQCHLPLHGSTLHCLCTTYSQILATHRSSSLVWKWPWLLLQSLTVGRCSSDSWRCLTSSTPGFSSSGLSLAASPSQRQVKKKKERKKEKKCCQQAKDERCCAAPQSSHFRPTSKLHSSTSAVHCSCFSHHF